MRVKEENGKVYLKLNIQKTKMVAYHSITSWQIEGEKVETVLFWGGCKITMDSGGNNKIKRHLLLGRKAMTKPDSVLENRDITLPRMVHIVKATIFPVVV